ncbi:MAG: 2Fe-2S iron-sulfur cluster-binding protein [Planctomycetota bacterium]|jgi:ferredoxin|nr:2Fe-2S iron-sulfur cluster-binding protein [Planctomycetota bacterium]
MPIITFSADGQSFEVPEGISLLEFSLANETPMRFGCTLGSCGTCCFVPESGAENLSEMEDEERDALELHTDEEGARLGCLVGILGDVTIRQDDGP